MLYRKKCGRRLPAGTKFCPDCGTPVSVKALRAPKKPKAQPEAPQKIGNTVIAVMVAVVIVAVIIVVLKVYVEGSGGRGVPKSALLAITAEKSAANSVTLNITHAGGDDLALADLEIKATNTAEGGMATINGTEMAGVGSMFTAGESGSITYDYAGVGAGHVLTVYIIHTPSKQKIFSSSTVVVQ